MIQGLSRFQALELQIGESRPLIVTLRSERMVQGDSRQDARQLSAPRDRFDGAAAAGICPALSALTDKRTLLWLLGFFFACLRMLQVYDLGLGDFSQAAVHPWIASAGQCAALISAMLFLASLAPSSFRIGNRRSLCHAVHHSAAGLRRTERGCLPRAVAGLDYVSHLSRAGGPLPARGLLLGLRQGQPAQLAGPRPVHRPGRRESLDLCLASAAVGRWFLSRARCTSPPRCSSFMSFAASRRARCLARSALSRGRWPSPWSPPPLGTMRICWLRFCASWRWAK